MYPSMTAIPTTILTGAQRRDDGLRADSGSRTGSRLHCGRCPSCRAGYSRLPPPLATRRQLRQPPPVGQPGASGSTRGGGQRRHAHRGRPTARFRPGAGLTRADGFTARDLVGRSATSHRRHHARQQHGAPRGSSPSRGRRPTQRYPSTLRESAHRRTTGGPGRLTPAHPRRPGSRLRLPRKRGITITTVAPGGWSGPGGLLRADRGCRVHLHHPEDRRLDLPQRAAPFPSVRGTQVIRPGPRRGGVVVETVEYGTAVGTTTTRGFDGAKLHR